MTAKAKGEPFDLDRLTLADFNLSVDEPPAIVAYLQAKLLCLLLRQMQIVAAQQEECLTGSSAGIDRQQARSLQILLMLFDKLTGASLYARQGEAVRVAIAGGYTVEELVHLAESRSNLDFRDYE